MTDRLQVLMVAEKPSLAASIAGLLSGGGASSSGGSLPVHWWAGSFQGRPASFKMTSVIGHVMSVDFPAEYQVRYRAGTPLPLLLPPLPCFGGRQGGHMAPAAKHGLIPPPPPHTHTHTQTHTVLGQGGPRHAV